MPTLTLLASSGFALLAAAIYGYAGAVLRRREVAPDHRRAQQLFVAWWWALGAATFVGSLAGLAAAFGVTDLSLHVGVLMVNLFLICVGLWGLLYYLLFLFTGRSWLLAPLTVFYALYFVALAALLLGAGPNGVQVGRWTARVTYENPLQGPTATTVLALLVFPQILGALAYFSLYFRLEDRTQRFRVALVSLSILVWFTSALLASAAGLSQQDWWQVASRLLGLAAALAVVVAYRPPRWLRERYGLGAVGESRSAPPPSEPTAPPRSRPARSPTLA